MEERVPIRSTDPGEVDDHDSRGPGVSNPKLSRLGDISETNIPAYLHLPRRAFRYSSLVPS